MYIIRVKMLNGVDEHQTKDKKEAHRIIKTAVDLNKKVMAWEDGQKFFDNVNQ